MLITWNIDPSLYSREQLEKLLEVVEGMDSAIASEIWEYIVERFLESYNNPQQTPEQPHAP